MTYITNLATFDAVADWYAKIKPLVSKQHTVEQDIRPIGKRSRKWERIIKLDDRTYALSCGGSVDPIFSWGYTDKTDVFPITPKEIADLSPIVWRKAKDGTETVTIRNGQGDWSHNSVYSFLARALPHGLWFRNDRRGQQTIYNRANSTGYPLLKTRTVPRHQYESMRERALKSPQSSWGARRFKELCVGPDKLELTFKRVGDAKFELVGEAPKQMVKRLRVDLVGKKKFKDSINEVYTWAMTMYPLMRSQLNWSLKLSLEQAAFDIAVEHKIVGYRRSYNDPLTSCDSDLMRKIILDREHPLRYTLGMAAMFAIHDGHTTWRNNERNSASDEPDADTLKRVRYYYNRWANGMLGFNKIVKEEK